MLGFLKRKRLERGLTLRELETLTGLPHTYITLVERGVKKPTITQLEKLAKGLKIDIHVAMVNVGYLPKYCADEMDKNPDKLEKVIRKGVKKLEKDEKE